MNSQKKSPPSNGRLGNFVCVDKKRLAKELSQFQEGVKSKEEVEATIDGLFGAMRRFDMGRKDA